MPNVTTGSALLALATSLILCSCGGGGNGGSSNFCFATEISMSAMGTNTQVFLRSLKGNAPQPETTAGVTFLSPDYDGGDNVYVFLGQDPVYHKLNLYTMIPGNVPQLHTQTNFNHHNPRFSPDGKWIVFSEDMADGSSQIFKVSSSSGVQVETQLTQEANQNMFPSVSHDNKTVVFVSTSQSVNTQIFTVPLGGGGATRIVIDGRTYRYPTFNNTGGTILCSIDGGAKGGFVLATLPAGGGIAAPITSALGQTDAHPRYASDNRTIVFDRTLSGVTQVYSRVISTQAETDLSQVTSTATGVAIAFEAIQSDPPEP